MRQYKVRSIVSGERAVVDVFEAMSDSDAITVFKASYRPLPERPFDLERAERIVYELGYQRPTHTS